MRARHIFRIAVALVLAASISSPAEAQLGKLGGAIKKKAKEVATDAVSGKEETKPGVSAAGAPSAPAAPAKASATPERLAIDPDVIDRMIKGMSAEFTKRDVASKRSACVSAFAQSPEAMNLLTTFAPQLEKAGDAKLTPQQQMAELTRIAEEMETKKKEIETKRCGEALEEMTPVQYEAVGAEAGGFTQPQYGMLKERFAPFCSAAAKGQGMPPNSKLVFSEEEMAAMRPRCAALLASLKKIS